MPEVINGIIYKLTNKINGKVYIGLTTRPFNIRMNQHKYDAIHNGKYPIHKAINKYGWDNFKKEIIDNASSLEELKLKEQYWIKYYDCCGTTKGYNATIGGDSSTRKSVRYYKVNILTGDIVAEYRSSIEAIACGSSTTDHDKITMTQYVPYMMIQADNFDKLNFQQKIDYIYSRRPHIICQLDKNNHLIRRWLNIGEILKENPTYTKSCIYACTKGNRKTHKDYKWMFYETYNDLRRRLLSNMQA